MLGKHRVHEALTLTEQGLAIRLRLCERLRCVDDIVDVSAIEAGHRVRLSSFGAPIEEEDLDGVVDEKAHHGRVAEDEEALPPW